MDKFTKFVNRSLPTMIDELSNQPAVGVEKVERAGARPFYSVRNAEIQTIYDYTLAFMLKEKMLKGFDDVMKFLSYNRLLQDLAKAKALNPQPKKDKKDKKNG